MAKMEKGRNGGQLKRLAVGDPANEGAGRPKGSTRNLLDAIRAMMEGDGYVIVEGEVLDADGKPTGQKAKVRAKVPTTESVARAMLTKMKSGDMRAIQIFLEREFGKPTQPHKIGFEGTPSEAVQSVNISIGFRPPAATEPSEPAAGK